MASAVATSIIALVTSTPPKALSGSPAKAACQLSKTVFLLATPHTLVCLIIAKLVNGKSAIKAMAASTSTKLL